MTTFGDLAIGERFRFAGNPYVYTKCRPVKTGSGHTVAAYCVEGGVATFVRAGDDEVAAFSPPRRR